MQGKAREGKARKARKGRKVKIRKGRKGRKIQVEVRKKRKRMDEKRKVLKGKGWKGGVKKEKETNGKKTK